MPQSLTLNPVSRMEAHQRLLVSAVAALGVFLLARTLYDLPAQIMLTWIAYSLTVLGLTWYTILTAHPREIRQLARLQDSSRTLIFLFVLVASGASLLAVLVLLQSTGGMSRQETTAHIAMSILSVICSWWLVHTLFVLRYAHLYYGDVLAGKEGDNPGGLDFPGNEEPDYLDFVYFSFIIGMTCQVSDVQITSRSIRRLAWLHGILTFAYNTVIVALSINIISSLLKP
jgi:uncharacterized membrane protein